MINENILEIFGKLSLNTVCRIRISCIRIFMLSKDISKDLLFKLKTQNYNLSGFYILICINYKIITLVIGIMSFPKNNL